MLGEKTCIYPGCSAKATEGPYCGQHDEIVNGGMY